MDNPPIPFHNPHFAGPYDFIIELLEHYKAPLMPRKIAKEMKVPEESIWPILEDLQRLLVVQIRGTPTEGYYVFLTHFCKLLEAGEY
jgi:hypothetical protein